MRALWYLAFAAGCLAVATPAPGVTVLSHSPNAAVHLGLPSASLEYENPLGGTEVLLGYKVLDWRDADFSWGPPPWYDDWSVSHPGAIDGNPSEIWMRTANQWIRTKTTVPSTIVSIHMTGDHNDGLATVQVDGVTVATLDMGTVPAPQTALIIVKGLANTTHTIQIDDLGFGPSGLGDDVHAFGAAALKEKMPKWSQPPVPTDPGNCYYGWNEASVFDSIQIAADDWVCTTSDPVMEILWWGSFLDWRYATPPPEAPAFFHITIWTDVPAGIDAPFSHPGTVIWEYDCTDFSSAFRGWDWDPTTERFEACYGYECTLPPAHWFYQNPETGESNIYWLSIAAVYPAGTTPTHPWGWKTRPRDPDSAAPDDAVVINTPTNPHVGMVYRAGFPLWWPTERDSWDLAFELTTKRNIKWIQAPNPSFSGLHAHDGQGQTITLANDWKCGGGQVTDLHWYGNYELMAPGGPEWRGAGIHHFHLSIHTDIPAGPVPYSQPGPEVWGKDVLFAAAGETDTGLVNLEGCKIYRYKFDLKPAFPQEPGSIYWFDITAYSNNPGDPPHWRWQEAGRNSMPALDAAVKRTNFGSWSPIQWLGNPILFSEMAYTITSGPEQPYAKWSQPPVRYAPPDAYSGWNELSMFGREQIVADDWACGTTNPVRDIHWWGSFLNWGDKTPPQMPDAFHIAIWSDVPAMPPGFSHPGVVLWDTFCNNYTWQFAGWDFDPRDPTVPPEACFKFEQDLTPAQWFWQDPGKNIYWVSIAAVYLNTTPQYPWGWKTRPRDPDSAAPDDAVAIWEPTAPAPGMVYGAGGPLWWPTPEESWDAAFVLTTGCNSPPQDVNGDGWVDGNDYGIFSACFNGSGNPIGPGCECLDVDNDGDVDGTDYGVFATCFNGTGNPPNC